MTLRHIKIFLAVCESQNNVTRAAEKLLMAQPAVSLALSELEAYYEVKLFDRLSRRLYLTEAGRRFRDYAAHITALLDELERSMRSRDSLGLLRVGASISIGSQLLPGFVTACLERYPGVDVRVRVERSEALEKLLLENELDFALMEGVVHQPALVSEDFLEDDLAVVSPSDGPFRQGQLLSRDEFLNQRLLLRERGSGTREIFDSVLAAADLSVQPVWESVSTEALINAVLSGLGLSVLPWRMVRRAVEEGRLHTLQVEGLAFHRKLHILYHRDKFLTQAARDFLELCRRESSALSGSHGELS